MRRLVKAVLAGVVVIVILFFFLAPVVGFSVGTPNCHYGPIYGSLSFHFFTVGETYFAGQLSWRTSGFTVPDCL